MVAKGIAIHVEIGKTRVFASAIDWPGWCRSAKDEDAALAKLEEYRDRYVAASGVKLPRGPITVVERAKGTATTEFGAPDVPASTDARPIGTTELNNLIAISEACWASFEKTVRTHKKSTLSVGPRGGGRQVEAIREHVFAAEKGYLSKIGASGRNVGDTLLALRTAVSAALHDRAAGVPVPPNPRRTKPLWVPRYAIRRETWHVTDHLWEIEDRA